MMRHNTLQSVERNEVDHRVDQELNRLFPGRLIHRVLLITPPDVDESMFNYSTGKRGRYWNYAPYGLGVIAAHLQNDGLKVHILNLNHEVLKACRNSVSQEDFNFDETWKSLISKEIIDFQPDMIAVTCMFSQTHSSAVNVCNEIKRLDPVLPIAIGGVHVTNVFADDKLRARLITDFKNVDLFFLYEAELAFKQFIGMVNRRVVPNKLFQVYFNSSPEKLYFPSRSFPEEKDLDIIPAHDLMSSAELMNYGVIGGFFCLKEKGTKITTVLSNRGCRGQCAFCSVRNFNGAGVRHRSVESVADELALLKDKYGIGHIMWLDDDFLHDHNRSIKLFEEIIKRKIGITWDCTNGVIAASCKDDLIAAAVESGCIGLTIGVESGNPEILRKIKKPGSVDTFIKAAKTLKNYPQINSRVFLMIGFPEETYRKILDTFNLAIAMDLDWYNITTFMPLPNTPILDSVEEDDILRNKFEDIRYNSGPHGKLRQKAREKQFVPGEDPFRNADLDTVPSKFELEDVWFYMNFHLNFKRLFNEKKTVKLQQQLKYVQNVTELVAPDDPFPMYFCGYLQKKLLNNIDQKLIQRLEDCLQASSDWKRRFAGFNLSIEHLRTGVFPEKSKI